MIKFPSALAAALTGLFITPLLIIGMEFIEAHGSNQAAFFIWIVVSFFIPVSVSVMDFRYWRKRATELGSMFMPMVSAQDFKLLYFPAWGRMLVWFVASAISILLLSYLGLVS